VTITEARSENLDVLRERYPGCDVRYLDLDDPRPSWTAPSTSSTATACSTP